MQTHELKTWRAEFNELVVGDKTFEFRKDDRRFAIGDTLLLVEWDETCDEYTGRRLYVVVTYIMRAAPLGAQHVEHDKMLSFPRLALKPWQHALAPGWVILGIKPAAMKVPSLPFPLR